MTYQPKPGDKVTSPLLVGEWEVVRSDAVIVWLAHSNGAAVSINREHVSPVAPPIPAEPPVGSVVFESGWFWIHSMHDEWTTVKHTADIEVWTETTTWPGLAVDAEPVVAVSQVADWLRDEWADWGQANPRFAAGRFVERFGWPDE